MRANGRIRKVEASIKVPFFFSSFFFGSSIEFGVAFVGGAV